MTRGGSLAENKFRILDDLFRIQVEIKAISAQPTEVGVGLSWAELGKNYLYTACKEYKLLNVTDCIDTLGDILLYQTIHTNTKFYNFEFSVSSRNISCCKNVRSVSQ